MFCAWGCRLILDVRLDPTHAQTAGCLFNYRHEFALWADMSNLDEYAQHTYTKNGGTWIAKSRLCTGQCPIRPSRTRQLCHQCSLLGGAQSVVRSVIRFAEKYYCAEILSMRLLQGPEAAREAEEQVRATETCWSL